MYNKNPVAGLNVSIYINSTVIYTYITNSTGFVVFNVIASSNLSAPFYYMVNSSHINYTYYNTLNNISAAVNNTNVTLTTTVVYLTAMPNITISISLLNSTTAYLKKLSASTV
jgi:hypothetical protein